VPDDRQLRQLVMDRRQRVLDQDMGNLHAEGKASERW
jgi:hypothetical protein